jgi:uncharacterized protein YcbX
MGASVAWISIAPVKALALVHPDEVLLDRFGVPENRRFYLVDRDGRLVNGKRLGPLVQVVPTYDAVAGTLALRFPNGEVVAGPLELDGRATTTFYGRPVDGRVVAGPWAEALSAWAGSPLRLLQTDEPGAGADRGRAAGVSLVSTASLDELARAGGASRRVDGRRFRMLFGVDGTAPHEEDGWIGRRVRIGEALVLPRGNVGRCAITTQNPDTGLPDFETLHVLKAYRGDVSTSEPLPFGIWGQVLEPGRVRLGDAVEPQ